MIAIWTSRLLLTALGAFSGELAFASSATGDYADPNFTKKYPSLSCIDSVDDPGELPPEIAALAGDKMADKLQEIGRKNAVKWTRPTCYGDGGGASGTITDTVTGSEYLDRLYARLTSGPIPHGFFRGRVVLSRDRGLIDIATLGVRLPNEQSLEKFAQKMWSGKYFDNKLMFLKNRINLDGQTTTAPTALTDPKMKFPAKLYCGQSLFDSRRESIVIDYKYGVEDRPQGIDTDPSIDWLAGPKGLLIRDEVRMVKPGLYLGRAYMHGVFGLYFVLQYVDGTGTPPQANELDACWVGTQRQRAMKWRPSDFVNNRGP